MHLACPEISGGGDPSYLQLMLPWPMVLASLLYPADSEDERRKYISESQRDQWETNPLSHHQIWNWATTAIVHSLKIFMFLMCHLINGTTQNTNRTLLWKNWHCGKRNDNPCSERRVPLDVRRNSPHEKSNPPGWNSFLDENSPFPQVKNPFLCVNGAFLETKTPFLQVKSQSFALTGQSSKWTEHFSKWKVHFLRREVDCFAWKGEFFIWKVYSSMIRVLLRCKKCNSHREPSKAKGEPCKLPHKERIHLHHRATLRVEPAVSRHDFSSILTWTCVPSMYRTLSQCIRPVSLHHSLTIS